MLADRIQRIGLSPTLKISAKAKSMKAEGIDVVDLSVGEPDFPTPENIKQAAKKAIDENFTKYTANDGILPLRKAICKKLKEENGVEYEPDEIIGTSPVPAAGAETVPLTTSSLSVSPSRMIAVPPGP